MLIPLLIVLGLVFGALLLVLRAILTRLASQATGHLQALSQEAFLQQEAIKKKMEETERQHQETLSRAQEEGSQLKAQILKEAEAARLQVVEQARQEAERVVAQAIQAREALHRELTQVFEAKAMDRACELLKEILPQVLSEAAHAHWLNDLINNGLIQVERLETQEKIKEAHVITAFPLTPPQRKLLQDRLQKALGFAVSMEETVDPGIIAGITITLGHMVLDGSLASKLREAVRRAQNATP